LNRRSFLASGAMALQGMALAAATEPGRRLGGSRNAYGERSSFEKSVRYFGLSATPATGSSRTPLQDLHGIITPSALHFERHHAGVPEVEPNKHQLLLHGLVGQPLVFTLADLRRLPSVSRICFIECSGNSGREQEGRPGPDPQKSHGLVSCSEWTGVPLKILLEQAGVEPGARWVIAEGADACRMARSIPLEKAFDDVHSGKPACEGTGRQGHAPVSRLAVSSHRLHLSAPRSTWRKRAGH
jgi:sulfane dehydrogenase subunit SoxC